MNAQQAFQQALAMSMRYTEESLNGAGALKGVGISKVEIDANNHLIVTFDKPLPDGTTQQDVGALPTSESFVAEITTPAWLWTIQHNLDAPYDELTIIATDADGNYIVGDIDPVNSTRNQLVIDFNELVTGKIIIKK